MLYSSDFMTMNGNLCLKRFIALLSLSCHSVTQHPMLALRGVLRHAKALGKTRQGSFYSFIGGPCVMKSEPGSSNINSNPSHA